MSWENRLGQEQAGSSAKRAEGFTLIEMMVAVGIIMIAFGFMVPTLNSFTQDRKVSSAGTMITTLLNSARNEAVTKKSPYGVVFYQRGMRLYSFEGEIDGDGRLSHFLGGLVEYSSDEKINYRLQFAEREYEEILSPPSAEEEDELRPEDVSIRFKPDGTADFGKFNDVGSFHFSEDEPSNADIILDLGWDKRRKGWIDIRPQGRIVFKVAETKGDSEEDDG